VTGVYDPYRQVVQPLHGRDVVTDVRPAQLIEQDIVVDDVAGKERAG